jgi:uncharacterized protein with PQ loop repeat
MIEPVSHEIAGSAAQVAGWIPAVVFPLAGAIQLAAIVRAKSARGVSVLSWSLFAVANVCMYVYLGKYAEPQAILSGLGTATLNVAVVVAALAYRSREPVPAKE